jgi:superfamily II DNA or RNA helicase
MATNPEAIKRFLSYQPKFPIVEGIAQRHLYSMIEFETGIPFQPKTPPRPYQLEALAFFMQVRRGLLFMKMRLGKTLTFLEWAEHLRKAGMWQRKALVIVPSRTLLSVWEDEIQKHSYLTASFVNSSSISEWEDALYGKPELVVISWSMLQEMFTLTRPKLRDPSKQELVVDEDVLARYAPRFECVCIDEIHYAKNRKSLRFELAVILTSQCKFFMGLTGTPHGRNPFDVWSQAFLADRGQTFGFSYHFFAQAYGKSKTNFWSGNPEQKFDKSKKKLFENRLAACSLSYGWEGRILLPPITRNIVPLPMTKEQNAHYNAALFQIRNAGTNDQKLGNSFMELRRISSGIVFYTREDGSKHPIPLDSAKLNWLSDLFVNLDPSVQTVIFHEFIETGHKIAELLSKHKVSYAAMAGATSIPRRKQAIAAFQKREIQVLVTNAQVGGIGVDFSSADYMCFFETPVSPTIREQAEARPLAGRPDRPLVIDDLLCGPVDRRIHDCLKEGKDLLHELIFKKMQWDRLGL